MFVAGWIVAIGVVVILLVATAVVLSVATAKRTGDSSFVVKTTLVVAALWAVFSVIGALILLLTTLMQDDIRITVPVREFWPQLPEGTEYEGPTAEMVGGGFTSAELVATGLSTGVRVCWAISQALAWLLPGAIAAFIGLACFQLLAGRAFAPVVSRVALITAVTVTLGGIAAQVLGDVAGGMAATELLQLTSGQYEEVAGIDDVFHAWLPEPGFGVTFPFWPIAAGLAFAALAAIFRYGSRLQRETELLV